MKTYKGIEAASGRFLEGEFQIIERTNIDDVMCNAQEAFIAYQAISPKDKAHFLTTIGREIEALGDVLLKRAMAEAGLPYERMKAERERTVKQLDIFAEVVKKGEWVEATIDVGDPNQVPKPKPDLRKQLEPIGPVVVFGASNFPLAYSAAGGDTASALAAGCPVIVKAHPAHPGTSQMVADAVVKAAIKTNMPAFIYQHVHDTGFEVGVALVQHPITKAIGFTGSLKGGKALFDLANNRPSPIPVFAEMGSVNPVLLFPDAMTNSAEKWGKLYAQSIALGCGQFCTNPGLLIGIKSAGLTRFITTLKSEIAAVPDQQMLHDGISQAFHKGKTERLNNVEVIYNREEENKRLAAPFLATVSAEVFKKDVSLQEELFGPHSLIIVCENESEMGDVVNLLDGQLTGTVIVADSEIERSQKLINELKLKVGRLIFNGVSTGVDVVDAMHHGGPFPATTDSRFTAVGPDAINRFARPVSYQNCPQNVLPIALKNENGLDIYRKINGARTKASI